MVQEILLGLQNLNNQVRSSMAKIVDSEDQLQSIEVNMESSTWRVSGELTISPSRHLHNLGKSIWAAELCLILPKYFKTFESS